MNNTLTLAIDRLFNGPQSGLDLESLCIIPNQQCWVIYIDAMVITTEICFYFSVTDFVYRSWMLLVTC
jgi:exosome complex RNA-binding protein Rrp42 (RNase PH superfamily)